MSLNNLNEGKRKVPVKFYQDKYGTIIYQSDFTQGTAISLEDAFEEFSREDFTRDLLYYYDDVIDVKLGRFIPSIKDKVWRGMQYLGQLEVEIETSNLFTDSNRSVTYLSKNKNKIPAHLNWIKDMKKMAVNEMFDPIKTNRDLICKHCGAIIKTGTYYEEYRKDAYHLECIWDKLINKNDFNTYKSAREFFFSLKKMLGHWPAYGYDIEEDYKFDLSLVENNDRILSKDSRLSENFNIVMNKLSKILKD